MIDGEPKGCMHGKVGYYITKMLSVHGYLCSYLHMMDNAESSDCIYCLGVTGTEDHAFFACVKCERERAISPGIARGKIALVGGHLELHIFSRKC